MIINRLSEFKLYFFSILSICFGLAYLAYMRHSVGYMGAFDTGIYLQLLEGFSKNGSLASSITGESNFLAHHFQPVILLLSPLYAVFDGIWPLLIISIMSIMAMIIIWFKDLGSAEVPSGLIKLILLFGLFHPSIAGRLFGGFVPEVIAIPLLYWQATGFWRKDWLSLQKSQYLFIASQLLAGLTKETIWPVIAFSNILLGWKRKDLRKTLWSLALVQVVIFITLFFIWMPANSNMPEYYGLSFYIDPQIEKSPWNLITALTKNLFSTQSFSTIGSVVLLFAWVIPFTYRSMGLLAVLPGLAMIALSHMPQTHRYVNQYSLLYLPYLFSLTVPAAKSLKNHYSKASFKRLIKYMPVITLCCTFLVTGGLLSTLTGIIHYSDKTNDIASIKKSFQNDPVILTDNGLQPFFANEEKVMILTQFKGNPRVLGQKDFEAASDIITLADPGKEKDCNNIRTQPIGKYMHVEAIIDFCNWFQSANIQLVQKTENGIYHFKHLGKK